jgi:Zn-finger protein
MNTSQKKFLELAKKSSEKVGNSYNCGAYPAHMDDVFTKIEMTNRKTVSNLI